MRHWLTVLFAAAVLPLSGFTLLDGTVDGSMPLRRQAVALALKNGRKISVRKVSAAEAVAALKQKKATAVVLESQDIPKDFPFEKHPFAVLAAAVYVNANNTCTNLSRQELVELLTSPRPSWKSITGNRVDIHIYGLSPKAQGYGVFSRLLKKEMQIKSPVYRTGSTNNVIQLCGGNPVALGIALFSPEGNEMSRPIAIDGVAPTFENLGQGRYPLMTTHVLVYPKENLPEIKELLDSFKTPVFLDLLNQSNMLPQQ